MQLDKVFSLFIRNRDSENGYAKCFTCSKIMTIKESQCGHFISRRHYATRWDEINCAAQCVGCNVYNQGNAPQFAANLEKKYGAGTIEKLLMKKKNKANLNRFILETLIKQYDKGI